MLEATFDQVLYLVEDLDHASGTCTSQLFLYSKIITSTYDPPKLNTRSLSEKVEMELLTRFCPIRN